MTVARRPSDTQSWLWGRSPRRAAYLLFPVTTSVIAGIAIALVLTFRHHTSGFPDNSTVVAFSSAATAASMIIAGAFLCSARLDAWFRQTPAATSWLLALYCGLLLCIIPVLLLIAPVATERVLGWSFPILDKRWLIVFYWLAVLTALVLPVVFERCRVTPPSSVKPASPTASGRGRPIATAVGQVFIVALCWYLVGPPWHLERHQRWIDWHEQMRLGGLQAISKGYLPFIGPAAFPHGPGTQLIVYAVMHFTRHFDLVGFREGWATLHLLGFLVVATVAYWLLGLVPALFVVLVALLYSPLEFFFTQSDGTLAGFYGWANCLRCVAPVLIVPTLAALVRDVPRRLPLLAFGVFWGICAWISQENLIGTAAAVCLFVTLLWLTGTISMRCVTRISSYLTMGFLFSVLPIVAVYAWHGAAGEFVHNYFVIARAVMAGWGNAWWPSEDVGPNLWSYYLTLPFLLVLAFFALWQFSPLRLSTALDWRRRRLLAFICVQLVCYQAALLRSDSSHLVNTLIALPFIIVLGFLDMPSWLEAWHPLAVRVVFATAVLIAYPALAVRLPFEWTRVLIQPAAKLVRQPFPEPPAGYEGRVAYKRIPPLLRGPELGNAAGVSTLEFLEFATEMEQAIGHRKTYIADLGRVYLADGLLYFFADLMPAPGLPAPGLPNHDTMTMSDDVKQAVAQRIRTQPGEFECFIGSSLDGPEARAFLDTHPHAKKSTRQFGEATLHILITDPEAGQ